jgi:hypothetical protein
MEESPLPGMIQAGLSSFYIDLAEMVYFHIRKTSNSVRG